MLTVVVAGRRIWSQSVLRCASVSVALIVNPKEGTALAQCGRRSVTGFKKTKPCGPHITSGDSIASPVTEFIDQIFATVNDVIEIVMVNALDIIDKSDFADYYWTKFEKRLGKANEPYCHCRQFRRNILLKN